MITVCTAGVALLSACSNDGEEETYLKSLEAPIAQEIIKPGAEFEYVTEPSAECIAAQIIESANATRLDPEKITPENVASKVEEFETTESLAQVQTRYKGCLNKQDARGSLIGQGVDQAVAECVVENLGSDGFWDASFEQDSDELSKAIKDCSA